MLALVLESQQMPFLIIPTAHTLDQAKALDGADKLVQLASTRLLEQCPNLPMAFIILRLMVIIVRPIAFIFSPDSLICVAR